MEHQDRFSDIEARVAAGELTFVVNIRSNESSAAILESMGDVYGSENVHIGSIGGGGDQNPGAFVGVYVESESLAANSGLTPASES